MSAGFEVTERGVSTASRTIIFIHGFPDTDIVFEKQYAVFEKTHRIVTLSMPGYKGGAIPTFGYSHAETAELLYKGIVAVMKDRTEKPIVVAHDWGSVFLWLVHSKHPELIERIVALDIAGHVGKLAPKAMLAVVAYQWLLLIVFLFPRFVATPFTQFLARAWFRAPHPEVVHSGMNYPYLRMWQALVTGARIANPSCKAPAVPVLLMYGSKKPFNFHSQRWLDCVAAADGSKVAAFPSDHWFFVRSKHVDAVNAEMKEFIGASKL